MVKEDLTKPGYSPKINMEKPRVFYAKVAIVGPSGSGKSYMTKTANKETTGYINTENKPLPYKGEPFKNMGLPKTWVGFMTCLADYGKNPEVHRIIIDSQTEAFNILNQESVRNFSNWDIAKNYNRKVREYEVLLKDIQKDILIFSHDELIRIGESGKQRRMVVHNKEHDGKIEEHYTIVLYTGSRLVKERPTYFLRTFEEDTSTKCPEGLFPDAKGDNLLEIPNDANYIFTAVEQYYS
jgi:hypothetical protein